MVCGFQHERILAEPWLGSVEGGRWKERDFALGEGWSILICLIPRSKWKLPK